jgi:hypothetical protein
MAFQNVASLLAPPQSLLRPSVIVRVLPAAFSYRPALPAQTAQTTWTTAIKPERDRSGWTVRRPDGPRRFPVRGSNFCGEFYRRIFA